MQWRKISFRGQEWKEMKNMGYDNKKKNITSGRVQQSLGWEAKER